MKTVFFDIETLSVRKNALVLSLGIVPVDLEEPKSYLELVASGIEIKFVADQQVKSGRHVDPDTVKWWTEQGPEAQRCLVPTKQDILVEDFYEALKPIGYVQDAIWFCKGPHFDVAIMESLFEDFNMKAPWGYRNIRDVRTALEFTTGSTMPYDRVDGFVNHNAVHDSAFDAYQLLRALHGDEAYPSESQKEEKYDHNNNEG